jgi:hypothetical protein
MANTTAKIKLGMGGSISCKSRSEETDVTKKRMDLILHNPNKFLFGINNPKTILA